MQYSISTTAASNHLNRRQFLRGVAGLGLSAAGIALLDGCASQPAAPGVSQETLETTTIRLYKNSSICPAPQYLAEETLKAEGFTKVQYIEGSATEKTLISGDTDISQAFAAAILPYIDAADPLVILSGVHVGCFELFATERINAISELKGKTTAVSVLGSAQHMFLASVLAYVGLNPTTDINWVVAPTADEQARFLANGKADIVLAFPPAAQDLRAKKIGHVILNSSIDSPWSHYFCCMVTANRKFAQENPVATKRALRAILKATDIVAREPERAARFVVDKGYTKNYAYALDALKHIPYNTWREYDPADTLRFYALRLRDAGLVKSSPDDIIARGTDWRFLNELKRELPALAASARNSGLLCHLGEPG